MGMNLVYYYCRKILDKDPLLPARVFHSILSHMAVEIKTGPRERFLRAYTNLPLAARKETILVLKEGPITWEVAYLEVKNSTLKSEEILRKLEGLGLI